MDIPRHNRVKSCHYQHIDICTSSPSSLNHGGQDCCATTSCVVHEATSLDQLQVVGVVSVADEHLHVMLLWVDERSLAVLVVLNRHRVMTVGE